MGYILALSVAAAKNTQPLRRKSFREHKDILSPFRFYAKTFDARERSQSEKRNYSE